MNNKYSIIIDIENIKKQSRKFFELAKTFETIKSEKKTGIKIELIENPEKKIIVKQKETIQDSNRSPLISEIKENTLAEDLGDIKNPSGALQRKNISSKIVNESLLLQLQEKQIEKLRKYVIGLDKETDLNKSEKFLVIPEEKIKNSKKWTNDEEFKFILEDLEVCIEKTKNEVEDRDVHDLKRLKMKIRNINKETLFLEKCEVTAQNSKYFPISQLFNFIFKIL